MAAIRDGLGRVRVAGEAIYQKETLLEGCFAPDRWWPLPPPFPVLPFLLLLPLLRFPCHLLLFLLLFLPISPVSFLTLVSGTHSITTTPLTRSRIYSPRVRSRKYKRHWRLMEMDEMRGKRTIGKWWKIEWGKTKEKILRDWLESVAGREGKRGKFAWFLNSNYFIF